jgi:hypothetical protein
MPFKARDIIIHPETLGDTTLLVNVTPYNTDGDTRSDTTLGYTYHIIASKKGYKEASVRIPGQKLMEVCADEPDGIPVKFTGLQLRQSIASIGETKIDGRNVKYASVNIKGTATGISRTDGKATLKINQPQSG